MPDDYTLLAIVTVINIVGGLYIVFRLRKYGVGDHNDARKTMLSKSAADQRVTKGDLARIRASLADIKLDVETDNEMDVCRDCRRDRGVGRTGFQDRLDDEQAIDRPTPLAAAVERRSTFMAQEY